MKIVFVVAAAAAYVDTATMTTSIHKQEIVDGCENSNTNSNSTTMTSSVVARIHCYYFYYLYYCLRCSV